MWHSSSQQHLETIGPSQTAFLLPLSVDAGPFIRCSGILSDKGGVVLGVYHDLCNGSHTTPQTDEKADKADRLQNAPLGGEPPQTCRSIQQLGDATA